MIDACSNPPHFRGVKTPITELLEQEATTKGTPPKDPKTQDKKKLQHHATSKTTTLSPKVSAKRPAHELPSSLPAGRKRPDLTATVDGKLIASEFQRHLFDDTKHGNCVRCHAKDHARSTCKEPVGRWEAKFDENKDKYWAGTLKWQQKAQEEKKGTPKVTFTTAPTLVQQPKQSRRHHLAPRYPEEDDESLPLQCRVQLIDNDGSDDDSPPLHLNIDPTLPVDTIDLLARASTGMNDVFSNAPRPYATADAASRYQVLQILPRASSVDK